MHKRTNRLLQALVIGALLCFGSACTKEDFAPPKWDIDVVGPLANTTVAVSDFDSFIQFSESLSDEINAADLGIPPELIDADVPCIPDLGPFDITDRTFSFDAEFESATLASGTNLSFTIINTLPVNIKAGTVIEVKSSGAVLFSHTINQTLTANGGSYTPASAIDLSGKVLTSSVTYSITNFSTAQVGNCNDFTETYSIRSNEGLSFSASVTATASAVTIGPGYTSEQIITDSEINLEGDAIPTNEMAGTIAVKFTNELPVDLRFSVSFPESGVTIFNNELVGANGTSLVPEQGINGVANITTEIYNQIRSATFVRTTFQMENASGQSVAIDFADQIEIQFIGKLKVNINSDEN